MYILLKALISIKNALLKQMFFVDIPFSKAIQKLVFFLTTEGYINKFNFLNKTKNVNQISHIRIWLKYEGFWFKKPSIKKIIFLSKPGKRIFMKKEDIKSFVKHKSFSKGILVIATTHGYINYTNILNVNKGGEILFYIE